MPDLTTLSDQEIAARLERISVDYFHSTQDEYDYDCDMLAEAARRLRSRVVCDYCAAELRAFQALRDQPQQETP